MPRKKPDPTTPSSAPHTTQPSVPSPQSSSLRFTIDTFDDPDTDKPTDYGRFSRNWQDEDALDALIDKLDAGQISDKQALMQARKLEAATPDNLEIQNFIANRLWALGMRDEAAEVHERAFNRALALIPKGYKGQITWSESDHASRPGETNPSPVAEGRPNLWQGDSGRQDRATYNRSFLRLAHGTLLGLMHCREGKSAMVLAKKLLAWCPMDNLGVRFLLGDIALITGDRKAAMKEYLNGAANSPDRHPNAWYQAALIAFRDGDYVAACTYLRRGIAANPYIAEGLTGRTLIAEHLYWHASNVHGPEWAIDYLDSAACDWTAEEIDFVDWVFNASPMLRERAELMELQEGLTYERDDEKRGSYAWRSTRFIDGITDVLSKKMVRKVRNRYGVDVWPWAQASIR